MDVLDGSLSHHFSFNVTLSHMSALNPFLTFSLESPLRFNFTDGTLTSGGGLIVFIRLKGGDPGRGDVLQADLCALSYCAQRRHVSVNLNQFSSTILQTIYGEPITDKSVLRKFPDDHRVLSFIGDDFNTLFPPMPTQPDLGANIFLSDSVEEWDSNLRLLMRQFQDRITPGFDFANDFQSRVDYYDPHSVLLPKPDFKIINAFEASPNISMTMENIATAMTNYVRDSSNLTVVGQVGQTHVYVTVIWPWIILPAFLVIASIVYLMLAMYESKRKRVRVWRTSELALLFHGRKVWDDYDELHALHRVSELEHAAKEIRVQMVEKSDGEWILHREKED